MWIGDIGWPIPGSRSRQHRATGEGRTIATSDQASCRGRRAWELYREGNSSGIVEEDVAVSLLAKHLVWFEKDGMAEGAPLGAAALRFLIALALPPSTSISDDERGANESLRQ